MILVNDSLVPDSKARVSVLDRGYYFGDGVYEVFRIYQGILFEKEAHLARLMRSAREARIALPCGVDELGTRIGKLLAANGIESGTLYVQITRGEAPRAHPFPEYTAPVLTGWCSELQRPYRAMQLGIRAVTVADIRWHRCDIKTLNLLPNVLAKQEAIDRGADEAIFLRNGIVTECSASNLMTVREGVIHTHPADHHILHGITRSVVLKLAEKAGIRLHECRFSLDQLYEADEVFMTGTTSEITPVVQIDDKTIADGSAGPVCRMLQKAFEEYAGLS